MNYIIHLLTLSFIQLALSTTPTWKMSYTTQEITTSDSKPIQSELHFQATSIRTYTDGTNNYISVTSDSTTNECKFPFLAINSYVAIENIFYICPSGLGQLRVYRYLFDTNTYDVMELPEEISKNSKYSSKTWELKCMYRPRFSANTNTSPSKSFIVGFLGIDYVFWYTEFKNNSKFLKVSYLENYIFDIHFDDDITLVGDTCKYYGYYYFYYNDTFMCQYGTLEIDQGSYEPKWNQCGQTRNSILKATDYGTTKILTQKKEEGKFDTYIMTFGQGKYSLYSASTINKGETFTQGPTYSIPLDFSPDTFYFTDFEFINQSTNFYYKVKTSSGKVYWGFGELLTDSNSVRIVFNSDEEIQSLAPYSDSKRGALISTATNSYIICPYKFSTTTYSCDTCPSGSYFFINSNYKNECVDSSTSSHDNMTIENGEYKCKDGFYPSSSGSSCVSCADLSGYVVYPGGTCELTCDNAIGEEFIDSNDNKKKTCTYCYLNNQYLYKQKCNNEKDLPIKTFISDAKYNIVSDCDSKCATCKDEATKCLTCTGNYYLLPGTNTCDNITAPPSGYEHYGIDDSNPIDQKWIECNSDNKFRFLNGTYGYKCITKPEGVYEIQQEINGVNYTFIDRCHANCETCSSKGDTDDNKCIKCKENMFQLGTKCVNDCGDPNYLYDRSKRICANCADSDSFKYSGKYNNCLEHQPEGTIVVNETFGIIQDCNGQCSKCSEVSSDDINPKCTICKNNLYVTPDQKCISSCGDSYVHNDSDHKCINCKSSGRYKISNTNYCTSTPPQAFHVINDTTGLIFLCGSTCKSCDQQPIDSNHNCKTCEIDKYLSFEHKSCESSCGENYAVDTDGFTCIQCGPDKYKMINETRCIEQFDYQNGPYYFSNEPLGVLGYCYDSCATCYGASTDTSHNCKTCKSGLIQNGTNCIECTNKQHGLFNGECTNCSSITGYVRFDDEYICKELSSITEPIYNVNKEYGIVGRCHSNCAKCEVGPKNGEEGCSQCRESNKKLKGTNCVDNCGELGTIDGGSECVNCALKGKYNLNGQCVNERPKGYYVSEIIYNTLRQCNLSLCADCIDEESKCIACSNSKYLEYNGTTCLDSCIHPYIEEDNKCVNCKDKNKYKYENEAKCIDLPSIPTFIKDAKYNIIENCDSSCRSCETTAANCITCKENYGRDGDACVNCKDYGWFKYPDSDECYKSNTPPEGYYVDSGNQFNLLSKCFESCAHCLTAGTADNNNCIECKLGYETEDDSLPSFNCNLQCASPNKWYYEESTRKKICLNGNECPMNKKILVESTRQCVESCLSTSSCEQCKIETLYAENNKCVKKCSNGYKVNEIKGTCDLISIKEDNGCTTTIVNDTNISMTPTAITSEVTNEINNYIDINDNENVRMIKSDTVSYIIYKNDKCGYAISQRYNLTYSNITNCINKLKNEGIIEENEDIIIGQIDIKRENETTNQASYYITRANGMKIDLSPCSSIKINVTYYLNTQKIVNVERSAKLLVSGIDVNNPKDDFFNDICFPYTDENGKDVTLKDRRKHFFENNTLCEEGCEYVKVNFNESTVDCSCPIKETTFDKINENIPFDDFPLSSINLETLKVLKCYNLFQWKYIQHNYGFWILFNLLVFQVSVSINFIFIGLGPIYAYLNQFMRENLSKASPPRKKSKMIIEENEKFQNSPFPLNPQSKKSPNKLDLNKNNNYVEKNYPCAPVLSNVMVYRESECMMKETEIEKENEQQPEFENEELDDLAYEDALEYDHRNICYFYFLMLKNNLLLISVFSNINVFEPFCIKLIGFFLNIACFFALNALLFDEEYISSRFESTEPTNFGYLIENEFPRCVYASFAAIPITILINYLSNSRKRFETLMKKETDSKQFIIESRKILKNMKNRIITFFVITLVLMGFFWYYVSTFCSVYRQTQVAWIEGTIITFLFCIVIYAFLYFIVTLMRYIGLKCHFSYLYSLSSYFI